MLKWGVRGAKPPGKKKSMYPQIELYGYSPIYPQTEHLWSQSVGFEGGVFVDILSDGSFWRGIFLRVGYF